MLKPTLFKKLLFFSILLALIPLGTAGWTMITSTRDELGSAANDEIRATAAKLALYVDNLYEDTWEAPLLLIRNAIDNGDLVTLTPVRDVKDLVWFELVVEGAEPVLVADDAFAELLRGAGLNPVETLRISPETYDGARMSERGVAVGKMTWIEEVDKWIVALVVPMPNGIGGQPAILGAYFKLDRLYEALTEDPFNENGELIFISAGGERLFDPARTDLTELEIVRQAVEAARSGHPVTRVAPYVKPSGERMLGGVAFPQTVPIVAIVAERSEKNAYAAVDKMQKQLLTWVSFGILIATLGAVVFSRRISRPIVNIGKVAEEVGKGNFKVRVQELKGRDEVADLAVRFNEMIKGLRERFELKKFVSAETMKAVTDSDTIVLGGKRERATVFFSDIRGFTAFSEKVEPEVVIDMLNTYLRVQAEIVDLHEGDIDKFVGDELVAVFKGDDMVLNAVCCAIEIQRAVAEANKETEWDIAIGIGINTGDMVMGAMGSPERMDYTILGDAVNLGARLCSAAGRHQSILSESSYLEVADDPDLDFAPLESIQVKGKTEPIKIYEIVDKEKDEGKDEAEEEAA